MDKCPKCAGDVPRTWINKRRQRVGKCPACRKLVSFGKASKDGDGSTGTEKKTPAQEKNAATAKDGKRKSASAPRRSEPGKSAGNGPESEPGKSAGGKSLSERLSEWFNRDIFG